MIQRLSLAFFGVVFSLVSTELHAQETEPAPDEPKSAQASDADDEPSKLEIEGVERQELKPIVDRGPDPLPDAKLPAKTRPAPDPARDQYVREPVYVRVAEVIVDSAGELKIPDVQIVDRYLQEYLRRAGFPIAATVAEAKYRIEGDLEAQFDKVLRIQGRPVAFKVRAECSLFLLDADGSELEGFEIPEIFQENVKSEKSAFVQVRRLAAKTFWDHLTKDGDVLGDREVEAVIQRLSAVPREGDAWSTEDCVKTLVGRGLAVVPAMLDALTDTRPVLVPSSYRGLTPETRPKLRIYHVADQVLEEIFQKVSRMNLDTPHRWRFLIMRGWENEWRRFCPPFRDSPNQKRDAKPESAQRSSADSAAANGNAPR